MADDIVGKYIKKDPDGNTTSGNATSGNAVDTDTPGPHASIESPIETGCLISLPGSIAAMLDLRFREGHRKAIPYGYITDVDFDPQAGIVITTADKAVAIAGRGLLAVYTAIINHTALAVSESSTGFDKGGGDPFVESITVTASGGADGSNGEVSG